MATRCGSALTSKRALASLAKNFKVSYTFVTDEFHGISCIRQRRRLYRVTGRGFPLLKLGRVAMCGRSKMTRLRGVRPISYVFVSPTHQGRRKKGAVTVSSYRPSMRRLRRLLLDGNGRVVVGLSPVLSLALTLGDVGRTQRIRIVSMGGRYGRLLLVVKGRPSQLVPVRYVGLASGRGRAFAFAQRRRLTSRYFCAGRLNGCLCRPGTSVLGTNTFHGVTSQCRMGGLRPGDRLCASSL